MACCISTVGRQSGMDEDKEEEFPTPTARELETKTLEKGTALFRKKGRSREDDGSGRR